MRKIVTTILITAILAFQQVNVWAADGSHSDSPNLIERLDRLGDRVFSGVLPGKRKTTDSAQTSSPTSDRAGSAFSGSTPTSSTNLKPQPDPLLQGASGRNEDMGTSEAIGRESAVAPRVSGMAGAAGASTLPSRSQTEIVPIPENARHTADSDESPSTASGSPLYRRMLEYRTSPFASAPPTRPNVPGEEERGAEIQVADVPSGNVPPAAQPTPAAGSREFANSPQVYTAQSSQGPSVPTPAQGATSTPRVASPTPATPPSRSSGITTGPAREPTPAVWQPATSGRTPQIARTTPATTSVSAPTSQTPTLAPTLASPGSSKTSSPVSSTTKESESVPAKDTSPSRPGNATWSERMAGMAVPNSGRALAGPVLLVETSGPQEITLGKPGLYEVLVRNIGRGSGNQVRVNVALPSWAEVVEQVPTSGAIEVTTNGNKQDVVWMIQQIDPQKEERLRMKLIPRESKPIELAVQYTLLAPVNETKIEVREPKLVIRVDGPEQVLFGRAEVYRLEVVNTGTGEADNVVLSLLPIGTGQKSPAKQNLGTIPAGEKRVVEVELLPRQSGALQIQMEVTADGGIRSQLEHVVTVVRPALEVAVEGPALQFVNQDDRYQIIVRNPGTAPAENIRIQVMCPESVEPDLTAVKGVKPVGNSLEWFIASLPPGGEEVLQLPCRFVGMGDARLIVQATAEGNLATQGECITQIQAVADLALRVEDPPRPVPVGKDGLYQIIIENRGSKAATDVHVVGFFSEGIEPVAARGIPNKVVPGQVVFEPISKIGPGEKIVLEIQARAQKPGNHVFRAELRCPSSDIRLAAEETTRYYDAMIAEKPRDSASSLR